MSPVKPPLSGFTGAGLTGGNFPPEKYLQINSIASPEAGAIDRTGNVMKLPDALTVTFLVSIPSGPERIFRPDTQ